MVVVSASSVVAAAADRLVELRPDPVDNEVTSGVVVSVATRGADVVEGGVEAEVTSLGGSAAAAEVLGDREDAGVERRRDEVD